MGWNSIPHQKLQEILVETSDYKEVTFRLNYLLNIRGFGVLTGSLDLEKRRYLETGLMHSISLPIRSSIFPCQH